MPAGKAALMPMDPKITELHTAYQQATGFDLPLRMGRDRVWFDFEKAGFTKEDLLLVIKWIRRQFGRNNGYGPTSLRFSTLLQLDYFEEKLMLARQEFHGRARNPGTIEQTQIVGDVARTVEVPAPDEVTTAREVGVKILRQLRLGMKSGPLPTSEVAGPELGRS
jgi:hypothetical protein